MQMRQGRSLNLRGFWKRKPEATRTVFRPKGPAIRWNADDCRNRFQISDRDQRESNDRPVGPYVSSLYRDPARWAGLVE